MTVTSGGRPPNATVILLSAIKILIRFSILLVYEYLEHATFKIMLIPSFPMHSSVHARSFFREVA